MTNGFSIATHNSGDKGYPPIATIVAIQERPSERLLEKALTFHDIAYPPKSALALAWDRDLVTNVRTDLRRIHGGRAKVTPSRYIQTMRCRVRGHKVAVINSHLVNNSYGPAIRGERPFRLRMWRRGWRMIRARAAALRLRGYAVFIVGDFNRKAAHWSDAPVGVGQAYDRIFYPTDHVVLSATYHGDRNGSDHRPLIARFAFKK